MKGARERDGYETLALQAQRTRRSVWGTRSRGVRSRPWPRGVDRLCTASLTPVSAIYGACKRRARKVTLKSWRSSPTPQRHDSGGDSAYVPWRGGHSAWHAQVKSALRDEAHSHFRTGFRALFAAA